MSIHEQLQQSLGSAYTIDRELGGGGMSRVFVATETGLGRQIVVKVLPSTTGSSVSAERFKREIQVAAKLQHPHIVPLLTAGEADGLPFYTMPFVKGESLRQRLQKGGELSVNETVHILRDVASALAYAHGEGVVHRDIKPENVMLSGGVAVVTDFGVAKAVDMALSDGGSPKSALTSLGVALGTPAYMAPEQATADPHVDHRADIYSYGCVAYEMLAGSSPFAGRPPQQLLAAHVTEAPESVAKRRLNVPPPLAALVMKCLEKSPGDRPQSADELIAALDAIATPSGGMAPTAARMAAVTAPRRSRMSILAAVAAVAIIVIAGALWWARRGPPVFTAGTTQMVAATPDLEYDAAISPDGKLVAYSALEGGETKIYVRQVNGGGRANELTGDVPGSHANPSWSPDGTQLAFVADSDIYVVPYLGGAAKRVVRGGFTPAWSPDGTELAYGGAEGGIWVQPIGGGPAKNVVKAMPSTTHSPAWSPDGRYIAFAVGNRPTFVNLSANTVMVVAAAGGVPARVSDSTKTNVSPAWAPDGRSLLYVSSVGGTRDVYQQAMRGERPVGAATRLTTGLGPYRISVSADGTRMAYDAVRLSVNLRSAAIPASGQVDLETARELTRENQRIEVMSLSHDGKWLAYDSDRSGNFDLYKIPVEGGEPTQLTTDPGNDFNPTWSPDDRQIAFHSQRSGVRHIYVTSADGSGDKLIASGPGQDYMPDWSPSSNRIAWHSSVPGGYRNYVTTLGTDGQWTPPKVLNGDEDVQFNTAPKWSPDGSAIAYGTVRGLVIASADGSPSRVLVPTATMGGFVGGIAWVASPPTIYFDAVTSRGLRIYAIPAAGGTPRLILADTANRLGRSDFTTDGKRLYFTLATREADVGVLELKK